MTNVFCLLCRSAEDRCVLASGGVTVPSFACFPVAGGDLELLLCNAKMWSPQKKI